MNSMPLVLLALGVFVLAYRFYYSWVVAKILTNNDSGLMPSQRLYDGQNYFPVSKWVLFGHHFAAIAGAGPLVGPVLAAQFGYAPGFLWIIVGAVLAGAMHDLVILLASVRHDGKSLAEIVKIEISKKSGIIASIAILIVLVIALSGLGSVVVNSLAESSWGTFTIAATIPIAIFMGFWMFKFRKGKTVEATIIGVILLTLAVILGRYIPASSLAPYFTFERKTLTIILAVYGLFASILPVWILLTPRDYLSSIMKLAVVIFLIVGILFVNPELKMPALTKFISGGGPIIPGTLFPYLFITIACGAISGFHALVSSGTTPKMIMSDKHIKPIAVGAMLFEGIVSIMALIAACSLHPLDYFIINVDTKAFPAIADQLHAMGFTISNIKELATEVGENIAGRPGGAVSLAVGMAQIFSAIPIFKGLMSYWYHFAIMFEALFILTTIDAGTRIGRFVLQEALGKVYKPFEKPNWLPGNIIASVIVVFCWSYFIYVGSIKTIWPMFGVANQLMAVIALGVGTSYLLNNGKQKYIWFTILPMVFVSITTLSAAFLNIKNIYLPQAFKYETATQGIINLSLTLLIIFSVVFIVSDALPRWIKAYKNI